LTHPSVIAGLDPAIQGNRIGPSIGKLRDSGAVATMDRRVKPGDDKKGRFGFTEFSS
jgi:hypothetical protein